MGRIGKIAPGRQTPLSKVNSLENQ